VIDVNNFEYMKIGLASPDKIRSWSFGEVKKAGDDQLPHTETGKRRLVLRTHLWTDQGLGVPLR